MTSDDFFKSNKPRVLSRYLLRYLARKGGLKKEEKGAREKRVKKRKRREERQIKEMRGGVTSGMERRAKG